MKNANEKKQKEIEEEEKEMLKHINKAVHQDI